MGLLLLYPTAADLAEGSAALPLSFNVSCAGHKTTASSLSSAFAFNVATAGAKTAAASVSLALSFTVVSRNSEELSLVAEDATGLDLVAEVDDGGLTLTLESADSLTLTPQP